MMKILKRTICKTRFYLYNIKMKKIILLFILIAIIGTYIYENRKDRLLSKLIYYALEHEDVVFETDIPDVEYVCAFMSFYSFDYIKPELQKIKAHYTPLVKAGFYKHRCGEGTSVVAAVKKDHTLFTTYLSAYNIEFDRWDNPNSYCVPVKLLHYKIKNRNLYITPKSPD